MPGRTFSSNQYRYGFNGMEKDDEMGKGDGNSYDFGARLYDPRLGRWLAVDPKSEKYPSFSPYNFTLNNPIIYIDPNGKEVYIYGKDAQSTTTELQKVTSLKLTYDSKTNQLTAMGEPENDFDRALLEVIKDPNVNVNLNTTRETTVTRGGKKMALGVGAFEGSEVVEGKVETQQLFNIEQAKDESIHGGNSVGTNAGHEIIESHIGGKESPGAKAPTVNGSTDKDKQAYLNAHNKAAKVDPNFREEMSVKLKIGSKSIKMFMRKDYGGQSNGQTQNQETKPIPQNDDENK